jgi:SAM-dependent methyltransferase
METVAKCPLCGGGESRPHLSVTDHTVSKKQFELRTCATCGFCITNPRPAPNSIGAFYASTDYISHTNTARNLQERLYQWVRKRAIKSKHALIRKYHSNGRVLDYGCGTGHFLGYLKTKGYLTTGVEPSASARQLCHDLHHLDVVAELDRVPAQEQFQIITLWHVLEHVHDVRDTLKKLHARAAKGALLVIAVPDRDSWDAQHYGAQWAAYDVPRHLSHFRRQDLTRFLREHGFDAFATKPMWFDAPYVSMLSERYKGAGAGAALAKGALLGTLSNLVAATTPRPTSSTLYLARKA